MYFNYSKAVQTIVFIFIIFLSFTAKSNPVVHGSWTGSIILNTNDETSLELPCNLYITDDNDAGDLSGEIVISYLYQDGKTYYCKARFSGKIDYKTYDFSLVMEEYIYYDILPENMKWCLGSFYGSIRREMQMKEYVILAQMQTKCNDAISKVVLVKQQ